MLWRWVSLRRASSEDCAVLTQMGRGTAGPRLSDLVLHTGSYEERKAQSLLLKAAKKLELSPSPHTALALALTQP